MNLKKLFRDPDMTVQVIVILLTLLSDDLQVNQKVRTMNTSVEKMQGIVAVISRTIESIQTASKAPKDMMRILE